MSCEACGRVPDIRNGILEKNVDHESSWCAVISRNGRESIRSLRERFIKQGRNARIPGIRRSRGQNGCPG